MRRELAVGQGKKAQAIHRRKALQAGRPRVLAEDFNRAKLTVEQVLAIREEYAKGTVTLRQLAAKYGVSNTKTITAILQHQSWRNVGGPVTKNPHLKLNAHLVRAIREEYAAGGTSMQKLGVKYGVNDVCILNVVRRNTWRHVD